MTNYEILGVTENVSEEELKKMYKYLCKQYHPDIFSGDKAFAEKKMKELNQAYDEILNEIRNPTQKGAPPKQDSHSYEDENTYSQPKSETHESSSGRQSQASYSYTPPPEPPQKKSGCSCGGCLLTIIILFAVSIVISYFMDKDETREGGATTTPPAATSAFSDTAASQTSHTQSTSVQPTSSVTTEYTATTTVTSVETTTEPAPAQDFSVRNEMIYECISIIAYQADIAIEYRYLDENGNNTKEIIGYSYNYDENFPFYVKGSSCYTEDGFYFIPLYYHMGTNCGTYAVIPEEYLAMTEEDYNALKTYYEEYDENAATIEFTVRNRVFGEDTSGRKVDIYFDGEKIGTVKGSAILITQEEDFVINTTVGTHTIEFVADALFAKDMYSKYAITVSNLGAYMEIKLSDDGDRIEADFKNLLDDYMLTDGMYYIEEVS